jgi:transcriptional regulator with XRE-family HTH domain
MVATRRRNAAGGFVTEELGARLRRARTERGVGLRELARQIGVSASLISQIETGKSTPSVSTLTTIANALSLSLNDVFDVQAANASPDQSPEFVPRARAVQLANGLSEPCDDSIEPASEDYPGPLLRAGQGRTIRLESGVVWQRLTSGHADDVAFLLVRYEPGGASTLADSLLRHNGREYGYLMSGRLRITIGFNDYDLEPGDSIAFDCSQPHRFAAIGPEPAEAIWFVVDRLPDR